MDLSEKLKAEKAQSEVIKEEQCKTIQAWNIKAAPDQDFCAEQKLTAAEKEKMLSLKVGQPEDKISTYGKGD
ncbi:hypothetical protein PBY51_019713 [Eleginops maclovinus]|uniref:Uncharacterized protein n=1 Tax=Eleginops maclovinus TaxID=56733 RepID=A0AAN7XNL4_ELEMC|nr:hypothetical protein PBY51_019713 [Eleginops maclovinus]